MEENKYDHFVTVTVADPPGTVGESHDTIFTSPPGSTNTCLYDSLLLLLASN